MKSKKIAGESRRTLPPLVTAQDENLRVFKFFNLRFPMSKCNGKVVNNLAERSSRRKTKEKIDTFSQEVYKGPNPFSSAS